MGAAGYVANMQGTVGHSIRHTVLACWKPLNKGDVNIARENI